MFKSKAVVELETTIKRLENQLFHAQVDLELAQEDTVRLEERNIKGASYVKELESKLENLWNLNLTIIALEESLAKANLLLTNAKTDLTEKDSELTEAKEENKKLYKDIKELTLTADEYEIKSKYKDVEIAELNRVKEILSKTTIALEEWNKLAWEQEVKIATLSASEAKNEELIVMLQANNAQLKSQLEEITGT